MPLLRQCGTSKLLRQCGTSKLLRACPPPTPVCSFDTILASVTGPTLAGNSCYCEWGKWPRNLVLDAMPVTLTKVAPVFSPCEFEGKIGTIEIWLPPGDPPDWDTINCDSFVYSHNEDLMLHICGMDSGNTNWYIYSNSWMYPHDAFFILYSIDWPGAIEANGGTFTPWTPEFTRMFNLPATVDMTVAGVWYMGNACGPAIPPSGAWPYSISVTLEAP
jgi:hypothetical protein